MSHTTDSTGRWVVPNEVSIAPPSSPVRVARGLSALGLNELADAGFPDAGYTVRVEYRLTGAGKPTQTSDLPHILRLLAKAGPGAVVRTQRRSVRAWPDGSELVGLWEFFTPDEP